MKLHLWGTDFRRSHAELRAALYRPPEARVGLVQGFLDSGLQDLVPLFTCNRTEFYTTAPDYFRDTRADWKRAFRRLGFPENAYYAGYHLEGKAALRHLFRVASSLESMVIGESQILGQLKEALRWTQANGFKVDGSLERVFQKAFETAKTVRNQTAIGERPTSVASLGVARLEALEEAFPLENVALVGRSEMTRAVASWLKKNRPRCTVLWVNRRPEKLADVPEAQGLTWLGLDAFVSAPPAVSVLVTATASSDPVFGPEFFSRISRPLLVLDFAEPPDVQIADLPAHIQVVQLEGLRAEAEANAESRSGAVEAAERLIETALRDFFLESKQVPFMKDFSRLEPHLLEDVQRSLEGLRRHVPPETFARLSPWADKVVQRQLHLTREHLREVLHTLTGEPGSPTTKPTGVSESFLG